MMALSPILRAVAPNVVSFWCPGCEGDHQVWTDRWGYNGDPDRPTFTPSIKVEYNGLDAGQLDEDGRRAPYAICHSYVTNGRIQFLGDCTHPLIGQTVDLPAWPD
jgi:hypothetical protein